MKLLTAFVVFTMLASTVLFAQNNTVKLYEDRQEYYFRFKINHKTDIGEITRIISIDNVRNDTVWAYANPKEFLRFSAMGYEITLLPPPGIVDEVFMKDNIILSPTTSTWNYYPTYSGYESIMQQFQTNYPSICQLSTLTTLASGRKILMVKISDNVAQDEAEPEFLYTSSIHGDEATGYILMLHLIDYLLSNYGTDAEVTDLVNNMEIFINPLANPDGTYYGGNSSVSGARRNNLNNVDLNRNYPDPAAGQHPDGYSWQPETVAFMDFASQHHICMAANFHGGAEVVNYPWDTWAALHPDNLWWIYVSREYADTVHLHSPSNYMTYLNNGITNGYAWYRVTGGRQDYMNYYQHCKEVTIEISNTKLLNASLLEPHWTYNWRSFILYLKEARYGIHGIVTDQITGSPVAAKIFLTGYDSNGSECYSSANNGDYHRPLKAGTYSLEITAPCYQTQTVPNVVVSDHATLTLNFQMVPNASVVTAAASSITNSSAVSGGTISCAESLNVTAKGVCWSTTSNPTLANNHTNEGSGSGAFTSTVTGLSASTTYYVRAYVTSNYGTNYGQEVVFSTPCGTITSFPWSEGFENGGSLPACWSQQYVTTPGLNWTFITGNGSSNPSSAHTGTYNACLKDNTTADNKTMLVTPELNLLNLGSPTLKFWHTQAYWSPDQDLLTVYYKNSSTGSWVQLATYTNSITSWTEETLSLPNASSTYYIAFEGNAKYGYGVCLDDVSITGTSSKTLNVSVLLEGLFNGVTMNKARNATGEQFEGTIADQIAIELHNATSPYALAGGPYTVNLNTNGTASVTLPGTFSGSYYVVLKHRNSIETWTASPLSFSGSVISYDFTSAATQAYGNNLKAVSGKFVILCGDVNQDGLVNSSDITFINTQSTAFAAGYIGSDLNGDGIVDAADLILSDNNAAGSVHKITP